MRVTWITLLILLLLLPSALPARIQGDLGLSLAWPQGDFEDHVDFAWGGAARLGYGLGRESALVPVIFAELGYLNYGRERRVEPFSMTIPDVVVDVVTDNYMIFFAPGLQVARRGGAVRPYCEVFGGLTYIATKTSIENRSLPNESIAESTNFNDYTYNIGAGAGLRILLWSRELRTEAPELREVLLDIKASYVKGGEAEYLRKGSISRELGRVYYSTVMSETDMLRLRIGVSVGL